MEQALADAVERLKLKADTDAVGALLDLKANVADVNRSLEGLTQDIESRAKVDDVTPILEEHARLTKFVRAEMASGRWIWKTGRVSRSSRIPWNVQSVNHHPEHLVWQPDAESIVTVVPGLYQIAIGIFVDRAPRVRVLVNDETVLMLGLMGPDAKSAAVSAGLVASTSGAAPAGMGSGPGGAAAGAVGVVGEHLVEKRFRHSAGNVSGWTLTEYLALPPNAHVSLTYSGPDGAQGFMSLRKL